MTLLYKQYTDAYDAGLLDLNDIEFHVNLVSEDYNPKPGHKKADVKDFIICSLVSLQGNIILKKSMSDIVAKIKEKSEAWIPNHIEQISADVDKVFALKPNKAEKLKQLIQNTSFQTEKRDYWENLVKQGIKYFVLEDKRPGKNLLAFCETIDN